MRIAFALIAILLIGAIGQAKAQNISQICAKEADARALRGEDRIRFEAKCRTAKTSGPVVIGHGHGEPESPSCAGNIANIFVGACPLCVLLFAFDDDSHCYVR